MLLYQKGAPASLEMPLPVELEQKDESKSIRNLYQPACSFEVAY
jgi:hypothetical protein